MLATQIGDSHRLEEQMTRADRPRKPVRDTGEDVEGHAMAVEADIDIDLDKAATQTAPPPPNPKDSPLKTRH